MRFLTDEKEQAKRIANRRPSDTPAARAVPLFVVHRETEPTFKFEMVERRDVVDGKRVKVMKREPVETGVQHVSKKRRHRLAVQREFGCSAKKARRIINAKAKAFAEAEEQALQARLQRKAVGE